MKNKLLVYRANGLFLILVLLSLLANIFVSLLSVKGIKLHIVANLVVSQLIILVPGLIFYLSISKDGMPFRIYGRIKSLTVFLLLVFTWLMMPLVTAVNIFSQLFTKNEVMNISSDVLGLPMIPVVLFIGIIGPFCEEFVFRGLINNCFVAGTGRYLMSGVVSGLFFGFMHMNLNQFCYAFVLGIIFALINDILGSMFASFICHAVVNTQNVLLLFISNWIMENIYGNGVSEVYTDMLNESGTAGGLRTASLIIVLSILLVISIVTTLLGGLLFYGICALEGKEDKFKMIFKINNKVESSEIEDSPREKVLYPTGMIAISICIFVMFLLEPIINLFK